MSKPSPYFVNEALFVFPEGPIGFDGQEYRYSKGERLYLDRLAKDFREIVIVAFVLREGDSYYESVLHSSFEGSNIRIIELPRTRRSPGVLCKAFHFIRIFFFISPYILNGGIYYLFLPSYPSAMAWVWIRLFRKKHFVYGADDWEQASAGMFKWPQLVDSYFYGLYCKLNRFMEKVIVATGLFAVAAGGQLVKKYKRFTHYVEPTTPRMVLSEDDIFLRADTCEGDFIRLINVGTLNYDKAQHLLIEAFAALAPLNPRLRLTIVGDGERMGELEALAEALGVFEKIEFLGYIEDTEELYSLYRLSDIFVLSSLSEGFPRVLYEAMTMGLPIITTDCGGIGHLMVDRFNGRVVPVGSSLAIADAIEEVIGNRQLRRLMIANGTLTMSRLFSSFDHHQIARMYLKISGAIF